MKIGIILGSLREERQGYYILEWVLNYLKNYDNITPIILDLKSYQLPFFGEHKNKEEVISWRLAVKSCDSFIFLAPEFNHSISGALKNALDLLDWQLHHKPAAFIGYGLSASGARAIEHLKSICDSYSMMSVVPNILISVLEDFKDNTFHPRHWHNHMLSLMIKEALELYPYSKHYLDSYAERRGTSLELMDYNEEWMGYSPAGIRGFCEMKKRN